MRFLCAASPSSLKKIVYLHFGYCKFFIWMARRPSIGLYCHSLLCLVLLLIYYLFSVCSSCLVLFLTYLFSVCGSMPCASSHIFVFCLWLYALCFFSHICFLSKALCLVLLLTYLFSVLSFIPYASSHIFFFVCSSMPCASSHIIFVFCL